jgi:cyanate permease
MRTVWATVLSVWVLFAVVAVLAWTRQQPAPATTPQNTPGAVVVKSKNGTSRLVVVAGSGAAAPHATTKTSPVPAG